MINNFVNDLFCVKDKVCVITGGAGHVCGGLAIGLAKSGAKVVVCDVRQQKVDDMIETIKQESNADAYGVCFDVVDKNAIIDAKNKIIEKFRTVDFLINGAGINSPKPVLEITSDEFDDIMSVNLKAVLLCSQVFGEVMLDNKYGSIVNISSSSASPPLSKAYLYSASKAGVTNITQNMAREWATSGVRVNALRPGFFPTEWNKKNFITKEREQAILGHTPMARYGQPDELVGAVIWLLSNASGFVTGAEIAVDGGFSCMTI